MEISERNCILSSLYIWRNFDRVSIEVIWWTLRNNGVMKLEVRAMIEIYKDAETSVKL